MTRELYSNNYYNLISFDIPKWDYSEIECKKISPQVAGWKNAFYWNIVTLGKARAYVVYDKGMVIHSSFVIRGIEKFPFLKSEDIEIGPCWTHPSYRGRKIYPAVLSEIIRRELSKGGCAYMIISDTNVSSQIGVKKIGFTRTGQIVKKDKWKRYVIV